MAQLKIYLNREKDKMAFNALIAFIEALDLGGW